MRRREGSYAASLISGCFYVFAHHRPTTGGGVKNRQGTILITMHMHFGFDVVATVPVAGNLQRKALETHTVVPAHGALELLAQYVF